MKLSLKFRDEQKTATPLIKAKIPITVLSLPFISAFDSSDLSFNLTTNFPSCPSLRFSYSPTPDAPPFTVSLKSGIGLFGSPRDSPLVISASLNLFSDRNPSFMLQIKPRFGHFSVHKTVCSNPGPTQGRLLNSGVESDLVGWSNIDIESGSGGDKFLNMEGGERFGFPMERSLNWQGSIREKDGILSGFKVGARSELPLTSKLLVNFRWGVNFPTDVKKQLPFLTMDKIRIQRVEEVGEVKKVEKVENVAGEVEKLNEMYSWLRRDLEELQKENRGLRRSLEEMKVCGGVSKSSSNFDEEKKKSVPKPAAAQVSYSGFSESKSNRNGIDESMHKGVKKSINKSGSGSLEDELQKAIKAASAR